MVSVKQAFVLGAGLGTRLRPLTDELPKPLVPIFQKPLITFALDHLIDFRITSFIINTHRMPEAFDRIFPGNRYRDHEITFVNEPVLLETGGGIKNVEAQLGDEPFITYSGDVLTDLDLGPLVQEHFRSSNDVTLALRKTVLGSDIALAGNRVVDIANRYGVVGNYDFANIAVWNPSIFRRIPPGQKISFIPILGEWISQGGKIGGVVSSAGNWFNIGSRDEYLNVHRAILQHSWQPRYVSNSDWRVAVHPSADVGKTAKSRGCSVVGQNCRVGADAVLEDTIVWPGAQIASRTKLVSCIVRAGKKVSGNRNNIDI
jgi:mannose-1-phosphate guanylyltransferase